MDINEEGYLTEEEFVTGCLQNDLLLHNMILHRDYIDNGGDHHFRTAWSKSNLKNIILKTAARRKILNSKRPELDNITLPCLRTPSMKKMRDYMNPNNKL